MNQPTTHSKEGQYDVKMLSFNHPNQLFQNLPQKEGSSNDASSPPPNLQNQNLAYSSSIITQVQNSSPSTHPAPPSTTIKGRPKDTATIIFKHDIPPL